MVGAYSLPAVLNEVIYMNCDGQALELLPTLRELGYPLGGVRWGRMPR